MTAITASNPGDQLATQFNTTCAVADGQVFCWGLNNYGQIGDDSDALSSVPVAVDTSGVLHGKAVTSVGSGGSNVCVVAAGGAYCWGRGEFGQLGDDRDAVATAAPVSVSGNALTGRVVTQIAAGGGDGSGQSCALASGAVYCWGSRSYGQLGDGSFGPTATPVSMDYGAMAGRTVTAVASGTAGNSCAVASGAAFCFGDGRLGQLGNGVVGYSRLPVAVDTSGVLNGRVVTAVSAGQGDDCAIADGEAFCWGRGGNSLGDGSDTGQIIWRFTRRCCLPPFRKRGHPEMLISWLNSPACTYPCQRFNAALADDSA